MAGKDLANGGDKGPGPARKPHEMPVPDQFLKFMQGEMARVHADDKEQRVNPKLLALSLQGRYNGLHPRHSVTLPQVQATILRLSGKEGFEQQADGKVNLLQKDSKGALLARQHAEHEKKLASEPEGIEQVGVVQKLWKKDKETGQVFYNGTRQRKGTWVGRLTGALQAGKLEAHEREASGRGYRTKAQRRAAYYRSKSKDLAGSFTPVLDGPAQAKKGSKEAASEGKYDSPLGRAKAIGLELKDLWRLDAPLETHARRGFWGRRLVQTKNTASQLKGLTFMGRMLLRVPAIFPAVLAVALWLMVCGLAYMVLDLDGTTAGFAKYSAHAAGGVLAAFYNLIAFGLNGIFGILSGWVAFILAAGTALAGAIWELLFGGLYEGVNFLLTNLTNSAAIEQPKFDPQVFRGGQGIAINYVVPSSAVECGSTMWWQTWDCGPWVTSSDLLAPGRFPIEVTGNERISWNRAMETILGAPERAVDGFRDGWVRLWGGTW